MATITLINCWMNSANWKFDEFIFKHGPWSSFQAAKKRKKRALIFIQVVVFHRNSGANSINTMG